MSKFKVYTTDRKILESVCKDFQITLDYMKCGIGAGYCCLDGQNLRVFGLGSHVSMSSDIEDLSDFYGIYDL